MSMDEDGRVAYEAICDRAEREANARASHPEGEPRDGGKCWECASFHEVQASDCLPSVVARILAFCGACVSDDSVTIVDRSEWHSADECWEEDADD